MRFEAGAMEHSRARALDLLVAGCADALLGEPRRAHPVRVMGSLLMAGRRANRAHPSRSTTRLLAGGALLAAGAGASWWGGRALERWSRAGGGPARRLVPGLALSLVLSLRELVAAGRRVRHRLERDDLEGARKALGRDLVSRDTSELTSTEVAGAAIQSLAENFNDSFVAPLAWASVGGLGMAGAYRFVNTADAVLGYRTEELRAFGRMAARSDDVMSWVPARLSAALLLAAAPTVGGSMREGWSAVRASAGAPPSPNGGWPMAAAAGVLDVRLEKREAYVLHSRGAPPTDERLRAAERLVTCAGALGLTVLAAGVGR